MTEPKPGTNSQLVALMEEHPHEAHILRRAYNIGTEDGASRSRIPKEERE